MHEFLSKDSASRVVLSAFLGQRAPRRRSLTPSQVHLFAKNEGVGSQQGLAE